MENEHAPPSGRAQSARARLLTNVYGKGASPQHFNMGTPPSFLQAPSQQQQQQQNQRFSSASPSVSNSMMMQQQQQQQRRPATTGHRTNRNQTTTAAGSATALAKLQAAGSIKISGYVNPMVGVNDGNVNNNQDSNTTAGGSSSGADTTNEAATAMLMMNAAQEDAARQQQEAEAKRRQEIDTAAVTQAFEKAQSHLVKLWNEASVPDEERSEFANMFWNTSSTSSAGGGGLIAATSKTLEEIERLLHIRDSEIRVEKSIEIRQGFLYLLQELSDRFSTAKVEKDGAKKEMMAILPSFRKSTCDVVDSIEGWIFVNNNQNTSQNQNIKFVYMWRGINYLEKMLSDLSFLGTSRLRTVLDFEPTHNPLLRGPKMFQGVSRRDAGSLNEKIMKATSYLQTVADTIAVSSSAASGDNTQQQQQQNETNNMKDEKRNISSAKFVQHQQQQGDILGLATATRAVYSTQQQQHPGSSGGSISTSNALSQQLQQQADSTAGGGGGVDSFFPGKQQSSRKQNKVNLSSLDIVQSYGIAASRIQALFRGFQARCHYLYMCRQDAAARVLQKAARKFVAKCVVSRLRNRHHAAIRIQALHRGNAVRDRLRQSLIQVRAATTIQRVFRGHSTRKRIRAVRFVVDRAVNIQRVYRGFRVRKSIETVLHHRVDTAATRIQSLFRGYRIRVQPRFNHRIIPVVVYLQAWFRGCLVRDRWRQLHHRLRAAIKIQAWVRGIFVRDQIQYLRQNINAASFEKIQRIEARAVLTLQRVYRGYRVRCQIPPSSWRNKNKNKNSSRNNNNSCLGEEEDQRDEEYSIVQRALLEEVVRSKRESFAALKIQTVWRGFYCRREFYFAFFCAKCAVKIQSLARGFLARRRFKKKKELLYQPDVHEFSVGDLLNQYGIDDTETLLNLPSVSQNSVVNEANNNNSGNEQQQQEQKEEKEIELNNDDDKYEIQKVEEDQHEASPPSSFFYDEDDRFTYISDVDAQNDNNDDNNNNNNNNTDDNNNNDRNNNNQHHQENVQQHQHQHRDPSPLTELEENQQQQNNNNNAQTEVSPLFDSPRLLFVNASSAATATTTCSPNSNHHQNEKEEKEEEELFEKEMFELQLQQQLEDCRKVEFSEEINRNEIIIESAISKRKISKQHKIELEQRQHQEQQEDQQQKRQQSKKQLFRQEERIRLVVSMEEEPLEFHDIQKKLQEQEEEIVEEEILEKIRNEEEKMLKERNIQQEQEYNVEEETLQKIIKQEQEILEERKIQQQQKEHEYNVEEEILKKIVKEEQNFLEERKTQIQQQQQQQQQQKTNKTDEDEYYYSKMLKDLEFDESSCRIEISKTQQQQERTFLENIFLKQTEILQFQIRQFIEKQKSEFHSQISRREESERYEIFLEEKQWKGIALKLQQDREQHEYQMWIEEQEKRMIASEAQARAIAEQEEILRLQQVQFEIQQQSKLMTERIHAIERLEKDDRVAIFRHEEYERNDFVISATSSVVILRATSADFRSTSTVSNNYNNNNIEEDADENSEKNIIPRISVTTAGVVSVEQADEYEHKNENENVIVVEQADEHVVVEEQEQEQQVKEEVEVEKENVNNKEKSENEISTTSTAIDTNNKNELLVPARQLAVAFLCRLLFDARDDLEKRELAALKIQTCYRKFNCRFMRHWMSEKLRRANELRIGKEHVDMFDDAACESQRFGRGFFIRKWLGEARLQLSLKKKEIQSEFEKETRAAIKMQCCWRCYNARFNLEWLKYRRQEELKIIAGERVEREEQDMKRSFFEKQHQILSRAALKIQCAYRCYSARFFLRWLKDKSTRDKKLKQLQEEIKEIEEEEQQQNHQNHYHHYHFSPSSRSPSRRSNNNNNNLSVSPASNAHDVSVSTEDSL